MTAVGAYMCSRMLENWLLISSLPPGIYLELIVVRLHDYIRLDD